MIIKQLKSWQTDRIIQFLNPFMKRFMNRPKLTCFSYNHITWITKIVRPAQCSILRAFISCPICQVLCQFGGWLQKAFKMACTPSLQMSGASSRQTKAPSKLCFRKSFFLSLTLSLSLSLSLSLYFFFSLSLCPPLFSFSWSVFFFKRAKMLGSVPRSDYSQ